jgi:hypothetical protein
MKHADKIPYVFILEHLVGIELVIKPMFGCHAVYVGGKLCLFLLQRDKPILPRQNNPEDQNGIYVATTAAHVESLEKIFPEADFQRLKAGKVWMFINERSEELESYATEACRMISRLDPRIGR